MLVDHADAQRMGVVWRADLALPLPHYDLPGVGRLEAHQAFHQGALPGAVLSQQRVEGARRHPHGDVLERGEGAEALGHADHLDRHRALAVERAFRRDPHHPRAPSVASTASERATAPKTPPCIVTILSAAR